MYTLPEQTKLSYKSFKGVSELTKLGGTTKTNRIVSNAKRMSSIEDLTMSFAFRLSRAENQRNERKAKRIK